MHTNMLPLQSGYTCQRVCFFYADPTFGFSGKTIAARLVHGIVKKNETRDHQNYILIRPRKVLTGVGTIIFLGFSLVYDWSPTEMCITVYSVQENCNVKVFAMPITQQASPTLIITKTHIFHVCQKKKKVFVFSPLSESWFVCFFAVKMTKYRAQFAALGLKRSPKRGK